MRFLEASVEWIALAIALLYLGWAVFEYLIYNPGAISLEGQQVTPATVDNFIDTHAAQRLRDQPNVEVPSFKVEPFGQDFDRRLALSDEKPPELALGCFSYQPFDPIGPSGQNAKMLNPVQTLPDLPAAHPAFVAAALDTIAPATAPAAAPAPNTAPTGKDVRLVVAGFTISWDELYKQWNNSFGPPAASQQPRLSPADFQILQISAFRSEKIGGKWGDEILVRILNGADLPAYPLKGDQVLENTYLQALNKSPSTIVAPAIPTVIAGAIWKDPLQYLPGASNQPDNSAQPQSNGTILPLESGHLETVNVQGPPPGVPFGPYGPRGGYSRPQAPAPPPPAEQAPATPTATAPAPGTVEPITALINPGAIFNPAPVEPITRMNVVVMPPKSPDLFIYVIDETAQSGRTYRYRISYKALNPLYNKAPQHVIPKHQNWVNQFDLASPLSGFSPEITVPVQTRLFCVVQQGISAKSATPFEIDTWSQGKWQSATFLVDFGDPIGGIQGGIDYSTGYTYVDKRIGRNNKSLVTLVDRDGYVDIRDASGDSTGPDYKQMRQWIEQQKAAGAAAPQPPTGYGPAAQPRTGYPPGFPPTPPGPGS
jgi:hypothetical protein